MSEYRIPGLTRTQQRKQPHVSYSGEHQVISYPMNNAKLRKQTRASIESELDTQGVAADAPIRGVVRHVNWSKLAVARSLRTGQITGALSYEHDVGGGSTILTDLRAQQSHGGAGTALMRHAAQDALLAGDTDLGVHGAVSSARPFYNKMGGMTRYFVGPGGKRQGDSFVHWNEADTRALARGRPAQGAELSADQFAGYIGGYEPKTYE